MIIISYIIVQIRAEWELLDEAVGVGGEGLQDVNTITDSDRRLVAGFWSIIGADQTLSHVDLQNNQHLRLFVSC